MSPSEPAWVLTANWNDGQKTNTELRKLTQDARDRYDAERTRDLEMKAKVELEQASDVISRIPNIVKDSASKGFDNALIMKVSSALSEKGLAPNLDVAQQKVFDALNARGLNPSLQRELYSSDSRSVSDYAWLLKANWKDGQSADPELLKLTHEARIRKTAEDEQKRQDSLQRANAQADVLLEKVSDTVNSAASSGRDSVGIMEIGFASPNDSSPPKLDQAQQKVFDALKVKGLNPTIEQGSIFHPHSLSESAWMITANWKDSQSADPKLKDLTHQAKDRLRAEAERAEQDAARHKMEVANNIISGVPKLLEDARKNGRDKAMVMKLKYASSPDPTSEPPALDVAQQKVFDALKAQGLNPSIEVGLYSDHPYSTANYEWVIKANLKPCD